MMPYHRRHDGLNSMERRHESQLLFLAATLTAAAAAQAIAQPALAGILGLLAALVSARAAAMRVTAWAAPPPIDRTNCNRDLDSFTPTECWQYFRFRKHDILYLVNQLQIPATLTIKGGRNGCVSGMYAFLYMSYRLRYPAILDDLDHTRVWGRDYSESSRIFNTMLDWMYLNHKGKVIGNIAWYDDRFEQYNEAIRRKLASSPYLAQAGVIPANLDNIFGFLDCTSNAICRPGGPYAIQNAFWNGYHHGHFIIYQGVSFPDGK